MESFNLIKGYGKVEDPNQEENTNLHPNRPFVSKRLIAILTISAIVLLTLVIGLALAALIHESNEPPDDSAPNSAESLKAICNVTQHPDSCFSTLSSSLNSSSKTDPESIFKHSLKVSIIELHNLTSSLNTLLTNNTNNNSKSSSVSSSALKDCSDLFEDALWRLQDSLTEMEVVGPGEKMLTSRKVNDIQTWISAALTDQETCLDGLEEMGVGGQGEAFDMKSKVESSKEVLSNSLAIIAHMDQLLEKFGIKMY